MPIQNPVLLLLGKSKDAEKKEKMFANQHRIRTLPPCTRFGLDFGYEEV